MSDFDHKAKAESRVYAQYRSKPKTVEWIGINGEIGNELEAAFCEVADSYDIDTAGTAELDVIGRIVVIDRSFESVLVTPQFECNDTDVECGEPLVECTPKNIATDENVSNEIYRLLIKAKISKNNGDATLDNICETMNLIFDGVGTAVDDHEDMSFTVIFNRLLNPIEKIVITQFDIVPRPQGVRFNGFIETPSLVLCGESWAQCGEPNAQCTFTF